MSVRDARPSDVPRLKDLGVLGWETTYHTFVRPENRAAYLAGPFWSHERLLAVVSDPACITLVHSDDNSVTGFLTIEPLPENRVELTRLYFDPNVQRGGLGGALLAATLARVRVQYPAARVMRVNVFARNTIGRAFYERHGFRLTDLCPATVGTQIVEDAWYELDLSNEKRSDDQFR